MKLRFRKNSLRLRLNQLEVEALAAGQSLTEQVTFPGDTTLCYVLRGQAGALPEATFTRGVITVAPTDDSIRQWSAGDQIGIYFDLPANGTALRVAIEKDLECVDGPPDERDPDAFPRKSALC